MHVVTKFKKFNFNQYFILQTYFEIREETFLKIGILNFFCLVLNIRKNEKIEIANYLILVLKSQRIRR